MTNLEALAIGLDWIYKALEPEEREEHEDEIKLGRRSDTATATRRRWVMTGAQASGA